ncbi:Flp family type IVb pilin [Vibrio sinensis]|uniref:Flp family type IVb pilin n=1 Tax=Vibrio sinensis TaxID=2302434 RepID=A0A3A6QZ34_9VIBR|nr:Flp family type IVb pilin [Vibrio sinensis]RJX68447.1 Flp family type IVb pilin [Vibrio sinensis]
MFTGLYVKAKLCTENFINDRRGVTAIEYAIIGVAISAIVLVVFSGEENSLESALKGAVSTISGNISKAN